MAPENNLLEKEIPIGSHPFLGAFALSFREGSCLYSFQYVVAHDNTQYHYAINPVIYIYIFIYILPPLKTQDTS